VQRQGYTTPKLNILLQFYQISEYTRPTGVYPLRDFHEICRICTCFHHSLAVKTWMDLLVGLRSYGGFKLRGTCFPNFLAPPSCETIRRTQTVLAVQEHTRGPLSPCRLVGFRFHPPPGRPKTLKFVCWFVCLSVCLSVRHAFERRSFCVRFRHEAVGV